MPGRISQVHGQRGATFRSAALSGEGGCVADAAETMLETPLADWHRAQGARMVPFAGYMMPVQYPAGIIAE
ncbi:hypothetical protein RQ832_31840, partial [Roseomonas sp. DSM 102946]|nr:hypothetical protein [Roseomonas sp. DSM 102946]